jgi:two-component system cell cycle sensor histidine kinase/response regulator CckA
MAEALTKTRETILVVDDINIVRELVVEILQNAHFNVLHADNGADALKLAADYAGTIHLLLSDVQMPEMTGPALGDSLKKARPDMHVMFMSGFTGGNLLVLNYGWAFIEKPFVPAKLVEMVNVVLHTPNKSQGSSQYDARRDAKPEAGQTSKGSK